MSIECILNRRSIRKFTPEPVSDEDIHLLLKAGMVAPSAVNTQPWAFIVVRDTERRKNLAAICPYWRPAQEAPLVIVVCADLRSKNEISEIFYVQDCSNASENILCAATGLGLGGVWLGVHGLNDRMEAVSELLQIPELVQPISVLAIGHPEKPVEPHDTFDESKVHQETFSS